MACKDERDNHNVGKMLLKRVMCHVVLCSCGCNWFLKKVLRLQLEIELCRFKRGQLTHCFYISRMLCSACSCIKYFEYLVNVVGSSERAMVLRLMIKSRTWRFQSTRRRHWKDRSRDLARFLSQAKTDESYAFIGRNFTSSNNDAYWYSIISSVSYIFLVHMHSSLKLGIFHS